MYGNILCCEIVSNGKFYTQNILLCTDKTTIYFYTLVEKEPISISGICVKAGLIIYIFFNYLWIITGNFFLYGIN